jgi:hypothetical protein
LTRRVENSFAPDAATSHVGEIGEERWPFDRDIRVATGTPSGTREGFRWRPRTPLSLARGSLGRGLVEILS